MTTNSSYPYSFDRSATTSTLHESFASLEPGAESGQSAAVAGRVLSVRGHGKLAFADLSDATGRIQLFAQEASLGDEAFASFQKLGVGDIVGAEGEVIRTRRGELSLKVARSELLAECLRPMPEKWHGMSDVEARFRQRYLDFLVNPEARAVVELRARTNAAIRAFLEDRGFVEVETPLLQPVPGGAVARPFVTHHNQLHTDMYLRVAPELYLKRLLIGGYERVYELNRSFRNEGISTQHNPEFTMLEVYEAYVDYHRTMELVEELVRSVAVAVTGSTRLEVEGTGIDLDGSFARITLFDAVEQAGGPALEEVWRDGNDEALRHAAESAGIGLDPSWPPGKVLMEVFETIAEKTLIQPTFIVGMPKDISPLAKDHRTIPRFTEHADLVIGGMEIAPIYSELNDPDEQRRRFQQQAERRAGGDEEATVSDEGFLEALAYGMPPAGGFGLGVDRFMRLLGDYPSLREVILFPTLRPEA